MICRLSIVSSSRSLAVKLTTTFENLNPRHCLRVLLDIRPDGVVAELASDPPPVCFGLVNLVVLKSWSRHDLIGDHTCTISDFTKKTTRGTHDSRGQTKDAKLSHGVFMLILELLCWFFGGISKRQTSSASASAGKSKPPCFPMRFKALCFSKKRTQL